MADEGEIKRRKGQVRPRVRDALNLIVSQGLTISEAARNVGMARESLSRAMKRPAVRAEMAGIQRAWRESETSKAWLTMASLASEAASEDVRFKSAKFLIELSEASEARLPPPVYQTVQIIAQAVNVGSRARTAGENGVFELPPFEPQGEVDDD